MPKYIDENIPNINTSWNNYKGERVEQFIKGQLNSKINCGLFDQLTNTLCFFANESDKEAYQNDSSLSDEEKRNLIISSIPISFSSTLYRILLINRTNDGKTTINTSTNNTSLVLNVAWNVQEKDITAANWTTINEDVNVTISVDLGATGNFRDITTIKTLYGTEFEYDVWEYLITGQNRVKLTFVSDRDNSIINTITYSILVSEMYIELLDNTWYQAIIEGNSQTYKLGGFKIVGSLQKTLILEIYQGRDLVKTFNSPIGTSTYINTPYYYTDTRGLDLSDLNTGVYTLKAYLIADELTSLPVVYNFSYVALGDELTAQLVCVNNVLSSVYNYSTDVLFKYSLYDRGYTTATSHVLIQFVTNSNPTTKINEDYQNITTNEPHDFTYTVEWLITETVNLSLSGNISIGQCSQLISIPIDNRAVYPAEEGEVFYMNAAMRNNSDSNRDVIINEATNPNVSLTPTWTNIDFADGIDGWTYDIGNNNRKALMIPAGSKVEIPYQAMLGENMAFEICYRVANVSDYNENIITVADNPTLSGFEGIRIRPTNITVHSYADVSDTNDSKRGTNLMDEEPVHLLLTIAKNYDGQANKNLVTGYINGCKNFQFDYTTGTLWQNGSNIVIGSETADIYVYLIRVYAKALGSQSAEKNFINSLTSLEDRMTYSTSFESVLNPSTRQISYDQMLNKDNHYNFFVVEMLNGATIPSKANDWSKDSKGYSNFEMHYGEHPEWDFKLYGVETTGQGTTSMDYYRWNLRFRIDKTNDSKKIPIAYYDSPLINVNKKEFVELESSNSKTVFFDGGANNTVANHPAIKRITAKINFASSMQGHKIGATRAFNDLHNALGLQNEAQEENPNVTVAVYQYPAFGFSKRTDSNGVVTYEFIGLFTIGPDKGDKPTFGYDLVPEELITIEGTDHSRKLAKFNYPWNENVQYNYINECLNIVKGPGDYDNAWEIGNCYDKEIDKGNKDGKASRDEPIINEILEREFKPAYDIAYDNSTLIFPIALNDPDYGGISTSAADILNNINTEIANAQEGQVVFTTKTTGSNGRFLNSEMEFWIEGEYILYHFDIVTGQYVPGVNLASKYGPIPQECDTLDKQNEYFKECRRAEFKSHAYEYWDLQDCIYHWLFCVMFGATDNFAKNSYPYKMKSLEHGGRWKWRQDDLDTIFDIDNTGGDTKPYYIEFQDSNNGSVWFAGSSSVFWNLIYECLWEDYTIGIEILPGIKTMGKNMLRAMSDLAGGSNLKDGCILFFKHYFWDNAQNYFPRSAYNYDGNWKYETAWINSGQAVDPLSQSLGDHFSGERLWIERRILYLMSLFQVGDFGNYSDTTLGSIQFRPDAVSGMTLTPSMWLYPSLINGAGSPETTARTEINQSKLFQPTSGTYGDGQTTFYIQASNYLTNLGDWSSIKLSTTQGDRSLSIDAKKLKNFKLGDSTNPVTTNVRTVSFNNTLCLETINASNVESLEGIIELDNCPRLKEAHFDGTNVTGLSLQIGSKIEELDCPDSLNTITFKNLKHLSNLTLPSDLSNVQTIVIENCTYQNALSILHDIYQTNGSLKYIRLIWNNTQIVGAEMIADLVEIANNQQKDSDNHYDGFGGVDNYGSTTQSPVIEGIVQVDGGIYREDLQALGLEQEVNFNDMKKAICSAFGTLTIIYDPTKVYIRFADPEVKRVLFTQNWDDGVGITYETAASVTTFPTIFKQNSIITEFNEFQNFKVSTIVGDDNNGAFMECSNLREITLPDTVRSLSRDAFENCSKLERINLNYLTSIGQDCFSHDSSLNTVGTTNNITNIDEGAFQYSLSANNEINFSFPSLISIGDTAFMRSNVKQISNLGEITVIPGTTDANSGTFRECGRLTSVVLPSTCKTIQPNGFTDCTSLSNINLSYVETISAFAFQNCSSLNTINLGSVTSIGQQAFVNAGLDDLNLSIPNLETIESGVFCGTKLANVLSLGSITALPGGTGNADGIFKNIITLKNVVLPNTLQIIGASSFYGCNHIEGMNLPQSILRIDESSFQNCSAPLILNFPNLIAINGTRAFSSSGATKIEDLGHIPVIDGGTGNTEGTFYYCTNLTEVTLPDSLTTIGAHAFIGCSNMTTLNFGSGLVSVGFEAFSGCNKITSNFIKFNNLTTLAKSAFRNCSIGGIVDMPNLTSIGSGGTFMGTKITEVKDLGSTITILDHSDKLGIFANCTSLTKATLPSSLTQISIDTFSGCSALVDVTLLNSTPTTLSNIDAFAGCSLLKNIFVPANCVKNYRRATNWNTWPAKIKPIGYTISDYGETSINLYLNGSGIEVGSLTAGISPYIRVYANQQLKYNGCTDSGTYFCRYDLNKNVVAVVSNTNGVKTYTVPEDGYVRMTYTLTAVNIDTQYIMDITPDSNDNNLEKCDILWPTISEPIPDPNQE